MDAVKFLMDFNRMHRNHYCKNCPRGEEGCATFGVNKPYLEKLVADVEQWSKEHPQRTRLQDFLEKYPDAEVLPDGQPVICCARLGYREYCGKIFGSDDCFSQCRDCWNMPVEEDE